MAKGYIHTVLKGGGQWVNEVEGGDRFGGEYGRKDEAVDAGRIQAIRNQTEHVIHNEDGTISERNSYGCDPADRPG